MLQISAPAEWYHISLSVVDPLVAHIRSLCLIIMISI